MAPLSSHHSSKFVKMIYVGDSGTGKTGSLTSLAAAGYKLRILDLDNGVDTLKQYVMKECPDKIDNIDFETRRDLIRSGPMGPLTTPKAFTAGLALMDKWTDDSKPSEWGANTIFVLDSLSTYGRAAFEWAKGLNPSSKDPRQWYAAAQQGIESVIALLTSEAFHCNVILISHINYKEVVEGVTKGYTNAIGTALGPTIPRYFNSMVMAQSIGSGKNVKRKITTVPTGIVDLKTPITYKLDAELPLETGLATLFEQLKAA